MLLRSSTFASYTGNRCSHTPGRPSAKPSARRTVISQSCLKNDDDIIEQVKNTHIDRRSFLVASGAALGLAPWSLALASEEAVAETVAPAVTPAPRPTTYTDPQDGFTLTVPPGWAFGEGFLPGNSSFTGATGARRTLVWYPEGANPRDVNVTLVITNVSVEFTKLGSFGSPYTFGSSLVNSQDRSYLLRAPEWARGREPIQIAKLVDAAEVSNKYFVEYTVQLLPEPQRHLYSLLALGYNGRYNRLYTLTAQTLEADRPAYEATLLAMIRSLGVPPQQQL